MNLEDYIKDLSPELQEKARACGSVEELVALAKYAKVPVPDEALSAIAGGGDPETGKCFPEEHPKCPYCGSKNTVFAYYDMRYYCKDCGREFG